MNKIHSQVSVKNVDSKLMRKLDLIASKAGKSKNEIYDFAFQTLVKAYETKHGEIDIDESDSNEILNFSFS